MQQQLTDQKYLERWANLYSMTLSIPRDKRFDMGNWVKQETTSKCGTAACMAGHAALHPYFRRRGLRLGIPSFSFSDYPPTGFATPSGIYGVFGFNRLLETPFWPSTCRMLARVDDYGNLTPKRAAKAVKAYIRQYWTEEKVEAAIDEAVVLYDIESVHKLTPWNNPKRSSTDR